MLIHRDFNLSASEDFKLNVAPKLRRNTFADPVKEDGLLIGWMIRSVYSFSSQVI